MRLLPEIQRRVQGATSTTERASTALMGAEKDADQAVENSEEAQSITTAIQQVCALIANNDIQNLRQAS